MDESAKQPSWIFIEEELQKSYLDYSMSMITARALPDVRDGLKPVHRRVLVGMKDIGLEHNKPTKKCANVVGTVMARYHPHGDSAIYDTLVRMAQDFSLRYPMVEGQGNFGSIDGDPPAAYRYTECRMTKAAEEMLSDIDRETVDFTPNYDDSTTEPSVLPARIPFLLVNGSTGIAVGMATNMAPHNLGEVIDAVNAVIDMPEIEIKSLFAHIPGPDFPTGGIIYGRSGIIDAYLTGRGKIILRGRAKVEKNDDDREQIVVTEIPYMVNKSDMLERLGVLVREKAIEGISFIRDESDRTGLRIMIGIKKEAFGEIVMNHLFKFTSLQTTFGIINLALVNKRPKQLNLKELIEHFISHRHEVVTRRTAYELKKAKERAHILEGLRIAVDNIDEIVAIIRGSQNTEEAQQKLISRFSLSQIQAQAILEMRLSKLTGLERGRIEEEFRTLQDQIADYESILANRERRMLIIKNELAEIKEKYGDPRKTEIVEAEGDVNIEDMIADEDMVITMTRAGYIKRCPVTVYRAQGRGGKGVKGMESKDDDVVDTIFIASAHTYILFFTNTGRCYWLKVYRIPEAGRNSRGRSMVNLLELKEGEEIAAFVPARTFDNEHFIIGVTAKGVVNKQPLSAYSNVRRDGINSISLDPGDRLVEVKQTSGDNDIIIATRDGQAVRFHESAVRELGRNTRGVRGITLRGEDVVVGMVVADDSNTVLTVTDRGFGKRTNVSEYRRTNRGGSGIINIRLTDRNGRVVAIRPVRRSDTDVMLISSNGIIIRCDADRISITGRNTQGVRLMNLDSGDLVTAIALCDREEAEASGVEKVDIEIAADQTAEAGAPDETNEPEENTEKEPE
jgi:DNA gyrase subunit A